MLLSSPQRVFLRHATLLFAVFAATGCAVGAGYGGMSMNLSSKSSICSSCENAREIDAGFGYYEFRLVDQTGFLMAALSTTANAYNERQRAIDAARARGAKAGDTVTYEVKPSPVLPGLRTEVLVRYAGPSVNYRYGGEVPTVDMRGEPLDLGSRSFLGVDILNDLTPYFIGDLPLTIQMTLNARFGLINVEAPSTWATGYGLGEFHGDAYVGAALTWMPLDKLGARLDVDAGIASPFLAMLGYGTLSHTTSLQAIYMPLPFLFVEGYGRWQRQSYIDRGLNAFMAGVGVGVTTF